MALDLSFLDNVTRERFLPALKNQLYNRFILWNRLSATGGVEDASGRKLLWDIVTKKHAATGLLSGYDTMASQPLNPTAQANLSYAIYYATLAISGEEERLNSGSMEKLLDMVRIQTDNARSTLQENIVNDVYDNATARGGRNTLVGLKAAVLDNNTYAGIDRTATGNSYWKANVNSTAHTVANLKDSTSTSYLPSIMNTGWTDAAHNQTGSAQGPDLIITTPKIFNIYQDIATVGNLRITNQVANLGFYAVEFGPGVAMVFDKYLTANYIYMLTLEDWRLHVFAGANFSFDGWRRGEDQDASKAHILWHGQLRLDSPWQQTVFSSVGAT